MRNNLKQVNDLLPYYDWILNESCFYYEECELLTPFLDATKNVFVIEYDVSPQIYCPKAKKLGVNIIF